MNKTQVVDVHVAYICPKYKNLEEWMKDPNNVYIGRGNVLFINNKRFPKTSSIWANPKKLPASATEKQRLENIACYKEYIKNLINKDEITLEQLNSLKGKNLGCWCKGKYKSCHGDALVELIKEYS